MSKPKSKTKNDSGLFDSILGTKTYKTTISNGKKKVTGLGGSPKTSQNRASKKWKKK
ncbi:MAG: hypothetical protein K9H48_19420 [Melioribacteraceae bacterium]|nr:hypothetical protein [Melioribacteraceae bacterium]